MNYLRPLSVVLLVSFGFGCSDASTPTSSLSVGRPLSVTADELSGTWTLLAMQPAGEAEQTTPAQTRYTLTFSEGRLSTRVDCNTCSGVFSLSGSTLTAGPALACTRAACGTMAFENAYTRLLGGEATAVLSGNTLVLSSPRGVLRFARQ
jgi:heat shock protein HslJ